MIMICCSEKCVDQARCDICAHAIYEEIITIDNKGKDYIATGGPIGCLMHEDSRYQDIAQSIGICNDFYCINAQKPNLKISKKQN